MSEHPPIPGYELLRLRARNGHLIYLARQSSSGRLVHLNVVHGAGDFCRKVAVSLRRQAVLLATLDHPNILRPVEVGESQDDGFFSALEYTGGGCLADKIRSGPISPPEAVALARAIASAMQYARGQGAVAYDLTPGSVLLTEDGSVKLADFRSLGAGGSDQPGAKLFTPAYAAPEEVSDSNGVEQTPPTDVYRIGAVLYATLTGQPPVGRCKNVMETIRHVVEESPAPIRQRNATVPADLEALCMKCLEKSPTSRYSHPGGLVDALDQFV
jgi:serine/threonine-protein kinase